MPGTELRSPAHRHRSAGAHLTHLSDHESPPGPRRLPESSPSSPGRSSSASDHRASRLSAALSRAGSVTCYAAGFLVAVAALLALPLQAQAQTTLVSNTGQTATSTLDRGRYEQLCACTGIHYGRRRGWVHAVFGPSPFRNFCCRDRCSEGKHLRSGRIGQSEQQPARTDRPVFDCEQRSQAYSSPRRRDRPWRRRPNTSSWAPWRPRPGASIVSSTTP